MSDRASRRLATALAGVALAMQATALALMVPNSATTSLSSLGFNGVGGIVLGLSYPVLGWLITSRRPGNPIGWIFLVIGVSQAGTSFLSMYAFYGLLVRPGAPLADVAAWAGNWSWVPGFILLFVMVLVFPDGTLPSRRWRPVLWLAAVAGGLTLFPTAIGLWGYRGVELLSSSGPDPSSDPMLAVGFALVSIGNFLMFPLALAALAAIIVRFRRSGPVERQQIRWFALAAAVEIGLFLLTAQVTLSFPFDILAAILVIPLVPIATTVAILRYRLYDLDRLISRTVAWTVSTGLIIAVFGAGLFVLETLLGGLTQGSTLAVAASTLGAFAAFQPIRRRIQRVVDRRFNRARYDAERTAGAFAGRLRDQVDLVMLRSDLLGTVDSTLRPSATGLWLRDGSEAGR